MKIVIMGVLGVLLVVGTAYGSEHIRLVETFGTWEVYESTDVMTGKQSFSASSDYAAPLLEMSFPYGEVRGLISYNCKDSREVLLVYFNTLNLDFSVLNQVVLRGGGGANYPCQIQRQRSNSNT